VFESLLVVDWQQFHNFLLQRMNERTAEDRLRYAKKFGRTLDNGGNASGLLQLAPDKRIHAMKALSNLAKFTGKYDDWLQLRQRYNLCWSTGNEKLDAFERFFDDSLTLDTMLQWLRQSLAILPSPYSDIFLFCTLTGLRASECVDCIRLIKDPEQFKIYYNESRQCLKHFRFPKVFIRRTKAAYISLVDKELLEIAQNTTKPPLPRPKDGMWAQEDGDANEILPQDICFSFKTVRDRKRDCGPAARARTQNGLCTSLFHAQSRLPN
jgi:hypothetical protein